MAYLALLWKARTIEKYRLNYEKEKINSILAANKELPKSTFYQKLTVYRNDSQKRFQQIYRNRCPEGSKVDRLCTCLCANRDFVLKIVIGFIGGLVLTYFWYKIFVFEFAVWSVIGWIVAVAITLGIAFSLRVRCLVLLLIPGLFSRVGRYTLACYALVLILTGPATNTLKNLDTLSDSLACGQEQIKSSVKQIKESKDNPLNLVKETMGGTVERIQQLASEMKGLLVKIHRLTMSIAHVLQSSLSWLISVEGTCNSKLGTPFEHCTNVLAPAIKSCEEQFPEYSSTWDWNIMVRALCLTVKQEPSDSICAVGDFAKGSIVATVKKKLTTFTNRIQSLLYVGVHIRRSHSCCTNGSLPVSQAVAGIVTDLRNRADPLLTWLSWSCTLTGLFLMLIIFRAKYYQHMFRTRSRFDNRYVTTELRELDLKRQRQGRETVLPLNTRERAKYVSTASIRLLPSEKMYLTRSIVFMIITTFKLMIHMVADYSLYWVLMNIRFHGNTPINFQQRYRTPSIFVSGSGPLAAIVRMLMECLNVHLVRSAPSTHPCLPDPNPPDLQRYAQIGTLILLLWLLALFEPYGLRLRHVITGHYQPERAKARAVWLYYHIIRTRSCFLKYARRKLHRQYKYTSEEKLTFKRWLNKYIPWRWLRCLLRIEPDEPHCLLCYTKHRQDDLDRHLKRCDTPSCPGVYCARCFMDIGQLCTICYSPEDYGDLSDVSREKFTSDDSENDDSGNDDDNYKGDMIPLLETSDHESQIDENATHSKVTKKNKCHMLLLTKDKNNQELKPLLECDYLNKAYDHTQNSALKCDSQFFKWFEKELETKYVHKNENTCDEKFQTNGPLFCSGKKVILPTSGETEITVKGATILKRKLGAIAKTMTLLTTKVNDELYEYDKCKINNKQLEFKYLVMEMFQPLEMVKRMTQMSHIGCGNRPRFRISKNDESFNKYIPFMYTNPILEEKIINNKPLVGKDMLKNLNYKIFRSAASLIQINSQESKKKPQFINRNRNIWSNKRNVKRYLEIKKIITDDVIKLLRKRNIHCKKHKFTCKRRRRRTESSIYISLVAKVSKVFSKKAIENDHVAVGVAKTIHTEGTPLKIKRQNKYEEYIANNKKDVMQQTEYCMKRHMDNSSNSATAGSFHISNVDTNKRSTSKKIDKIGGVQLENQSEGKIIELEIKETTPRKVGFWTRLFLNKREHSTRTFTSCAKDQPVSNSSFLNHKKRKKIPIYYQSTAVRTAHSKPSKVDDDDVRSYRIALYLKDREWLLKMAKYNSVLDVPNDDVLAGLDSKTSKRLSKEIKRWDKEEVKKRIREEKLRRSNEEKLRKAEQKAKSSKEKNTNKKKNWSASKKCICDEQSNNQNEIRLSQAESCLMKRLKSISHNPLKSFSKHVGINISGAGVKFSTQCKDAENKIVKEHSNEKNKLEQTSSVLFITSSSNDKTITREPTKSQHNLDEMELNEDKPSETEDEDVDEQCENAVQSNLPVKCMASCSHIWHVEPKKQAICQTAEKSYPNQVVHNMLHKVSRCFQVEMNPEVNDMDTSSESLKNSKRSQLTTIFGRFKKGGKTGDDKEVTACPELKSRWSQCEAIWRMDKQIQVHQSHCGQHVETQCMPTAFLCSLQSSAIETEKPETRTCASQCRPVSYRNEIIKELTEDLISPYVTIEYTDEKPVRVKKARIKDVATSHQSTTTDTKTLADVSTATDWWSPILERKEVKRKQGGITLAVSSNESVPQRPQFFPEEIGDILSPSKYLFQSDYYNQIYFMKHGTSAGSSRPLHCLQRWDELEKPSKLSHKLRKGPKSKRLEECYSPRKKMQSSTLNLVPPKWRPAEDHQHHALKYYKRRSSKKSSHKSRKSRNDKERSKNMQVKCC